jgi:hypothetical protein
MPDFNRGMVLGLRGAGCFPYNPLDFCVLQVVLQGCDPKAGQSPDDIQEAGT